MMDVMDDLMDQDVMGDGGASFNHSSQADWVKWQSSQPCPPLSKLLKVVDDSIIGSSSTSTPNRCTYSSTTLLRFAQDFSAYQRFASHELIPGAPRPSFKSSTRPSAAKRHRAKQSEAQTALIRSPLDRRAPLEILDVMSSVSARLDESAPIRPASVGPQRSTKSRRTVPTPLDARQGAQSTKTIEQRMMQVGLNTPLSGKGKGKADPPKLACTLPSSQRANSSFSTSNGSFMDVDTSFTTDTDASFHPVPQRAAPPLKEAASQAKMPPPNVLARKPIPAAQPPQMVAAVRSNPNCSTFAHPPATYSIVPKPAPAPATVTISSKLKEKEATAQSYNEIQTNDPCYPRTTNVQNPSGRSTTFSSTQSAAVPLTASQSRNPILGMRRAHTEPTRAGYGASGQLPTKQKAFKPPLLSASQPQQTQAPSRTQTKAKPPVALQSGVTRTGTSGAYYGKTGVGKTIPSREETTPELESDGAPSSDAIDPDSSFPDLPSFDDDALEETMRMFD